MESFNKFFGFFLQTENIFLSTFIEKTKKKFLLPINNSKIVKTFKSSTEIIFLTLFENFIYLRFLIFRITPKKPIVFY